MKGDDVRETLFSVNRNIVSRPSPLHVVDLYKTVCRAPTVIGVLLYIFLLLFIRRFFIFGASRARAIQSLPVVTEGRHCWARAQRYYVDSGDTCFPSL